MQKYIMCGLGLAILQSILCIIAYNKGYHNATNACIANASTTIIKENIKAQQITESQVIYRDKIITKYQIIYRDVAKYDTEKCIMRNDLTNMFNGE